MPKRMSSISWVVPAYSHRGPRATPAVRQHFPSIDHGILRAALFRHVPEPGLRRVIDAILASGQQSPDPQAPDDGHLFARDHLLALAAVIVVQQFERQAVQLVFGQGVVQPQQADPADQGLSLRVVLQGRPEASVTTLAIGLDLRQLSASQGDTSTSAAAWPLSWPVGRAW